MQQPKMGGKEVTRLFIKGNDDLVDSLLSRQSGGTKLDKGVVECVRDQFDGKFKVDVGKETAVTTDILLQQLNGTTAPSDLDNDFMAAQFESKLFDGENDIIALSILPDMLYTRWRHQGTGALVCPPLDWQQSWPAEQKDAFMSRYSPVGQLTAVEYKENLTQLVQTLKEKTDAHIILFGASSFDPDDQTHNFHGKEDNLTLRVHRFNVVMLQLSSEEGITFIDVDRILAELGCGEHVLKALTYSDTTYQTICEEFMRVITDVSFFEERPILVQMGQRKR